MRVAISREAVKGSREGLLHDFHWTDEGELLGLPAIVCEGEKRFRDKCGCGRAFAGMQSAKTCTTAVVEERTEEEVMAILRESPSVKSWTDLDADLFKAFEDDQRLIDEALADCALGATIRIINDPGDHETGASFQIAEEIPPVAATATRGRRA